MKIKYIGTRNVYVEVGGYTGLVKNGDVFEVADGTVFDSVKFELVGNDNLTKKKIKKADCCTVE
jgi:hypothetical protein